jgi:hypothetical protein
MTSDLEEELRSSWEAMESSSMATTAVHRDILARAHRRTRRNATTAVLGVAAASAAVVGVLSQAAQPHRTPVPPESTSPAQRNPQTIIGSGIDTVEVTGAATSGGRTQPTKVTFVGSNVRHLVQVLNALPLARPQAKQCAAPTTETLVFYQGEQTVTFAYHAVCHQLEANVDGIRADALGTVGSSLDATLVHFPLSESVTVVSPEPQPQSPSPRDVAIYTRALKLLGHGYRQSGSGVLMSATGGEVVGTSLLFSGPEGTVSITQTPLGSGGKAKPGSLPAVPEQGRTAVVSNVRESVMVTVVTAHSRPPLLAGAHLHAFAAAVLAVAG